MNKIGLILGLCNLGNVVLVYLYRKQLYQWLPADDAIAIIIAWAVVTIILCVTGFFLSKYNEETRKAAGILGMAVNGLVMLPVGVCSLICLILLKNYKTINKNVTIRRI